MKAIKALALGQDEELDHQHQHGVGHDVEGGSIGVGGKSPRNFAASMIETKARSAFILINANSHNGFAALASGSGHFKLGSYFGVTLWRKKTKMGDYPVSVSLFFLPQFPVKI